MGILDSEGVVLVTFVVIGRNEAAGLADCLESIRGQDWDGGVQIVYVDGQSSDRSPQIAAAVEGVEVLTVDGTPNAAKGRNLGWSRARGELVQFLDGDAVLEPGWTRVAVAAMEDPDVAAVFGWFDELRPEASIYNRLANLDWPRDAGEVDAFGGIVMVRRSCLEEGGGFPEAALSGEEPLLALTLRGLGYRVLQVPVLMAHHDMDTHDFVTYWRRCVLTGVSYAEQIRGKRALGVRWRSTRTGKNLMAAVVGLAVGLGCVVGAGLGVGVGVGLAVGGLLGMDLARVAWRNRERAGSARAALTYAVHVRLIILAQLVGLVRWVRRRGFRGRRTSPLNPIPKPLQ